MLPFAEHRSYPRDLAVQGSTGNGIDFLAHWHPDVELCLVTEGRLVVGVDGERAELGPGDLAVCASNVIHHYQKTGVPTRHQMVIFRPEATGYPGIWPQQRQLVKSFWKAQEVGDVAALVTALVGEHEHHDEFRTQVLRGLVIQLCGLMDRRLTKPRAAPSGKPLGPLRLRMAEAISFIRSRSATTLTLEAVAAHVNLSPWYFSRCFREACGTGFKAYLNALRVEEAGRLLNASDRTILDIALSCGFSGARSFHRAFRSATGHSPRAAQPLSPVGP